MLEEKGSTQEEFVEVDAMPRRNHSHTSRSDLFGLCRAEPFEDFLVDSVSFTFLSQRSLAGSPL